jgi:hypothetical protein
MKRVVICTLLSFLLAVSVAFTNEKPKMTYCETADQAAKEKERKALLINPDGTFRKLADVGQCTETGVCVLWESYGPCGMIKQFVDLNNDGTCDQVLEWNSIVDPKFGVFWNLRRVSRKCPLTA